MQETIEFYDMLRFALSDKLMLKTQNVLIYNKMAFFVDFAVFFRTADGLLRYGTVRRAKKFALPTV
jgi:hypothetical protein